jgi:hypothetical protein
VTTLGSGRPVNATVAGDPNQDDNSFNDRLPGIRRNSLVGPDYATSDVRLSRRLYLGDRFKLELIGESFNVLNRDNRRILTTDDGFQSGSTQFVQSDKSLNNRHFPAHYRLPTNFLRIRDAYASGATCVAAGFLTRDISNFAADAIRIIGRNCAHNT